MKIKVLLFVFAITISFGATSTFAEIPTDYDFVIPLIEAFPNSGQGGGSDKDPSESKKAYVKENSDGSYTVTVITSEGYLIESPDDHWVKNLALNGKDSKIADGNSENFEYIYMDGFDEPIGYSLTFFYSGNIEDLSVHTLVYPDNSYGNDLIPGVPIDNGLIFLMLAGLGYGAYTYRERQTQVAEV